MKLAEIHVAVGKLLGWQVSYASVARVHVGLVVVADSHDHVRMTVAEHLEREQAAVAAVVVSDLLASNVQTPRCGESARPTLFAQIRGRKE